MRLDQFRDFEPQVDKEEIEVAGAEAFLSANPSFYASEWNGELMVAWCRQQNVPTTRLNLTLAYQQLRAEGLLEIPPAEPVLTIRQSDAFINALAKDTVEELKTLEKLRDDPMLSDTTRKKRDAALKKLAIASRLANRRGLHLRGSERIVI